MVQVGQERLCFIIFLIQCAPSLVKANVIPDVVIGKIVCAIILGSIFKIFCPIILDLNDKGILNLNVTVKETVQLNCGTPQELPESSQTIWKKDGIRLKNKGSLILSKY